MQSNAIVSHEAGMNDRVAATAPAVAARISAAIEPFTDGVIIEMVASCAFLRRVSARGANK